MKKLCKAVYERPKLNSRLIWRINQAKEAITTIKNEHYYDDYPHRQFPPEEVTQRIRSASRELESICLYGKYKIPQKVEQEMVIATYAINSTVKYYGRCGYSFIGNLCDFRVCSKISNF